MNRREFLKVSGVASGLFMLLMAPRVSKIATTQSHPTSNGNLYRGTQDGKIYRSQDKGRSWSLHTNLGNRYSIRGFSENRTGQIAAHVSFDQYDFNLQLSSDGRSWQVV